MFCIKFLRHPKAEGNDAEMYSRIRDLREDKDLLQKDMAEALHCTQVCYSNYETGKRDIPTETLIKLAIFHHTSIDYLLGLTNERIPYPRNARNFT